jgi:hypothetical protein
MPNKKIQEGDQPNFAEPKSNVAWSDPFCVQCGRKVGANPWYVEVIDGGYIRRQDGTPADQNDAGYMGCWAVGNECAKAFAPDLLFKQIVTAHEPAMCEICEANEKENHEGKWCTSCKDDFKESK